MCRHMQSLAVLVLSIFISPAVGAQLATGYAVIDGTQDPPQVVSTNIDLSITDNGTGNFVLLFDEPVVFLLATARSEGGGFDAGSTFLTAIQDSANPYRVNVNTFTINPLEGHSLTNAIFSVKVVSIPVFVNGFEN